MDYEPINYRVRGACVTLGVGETKLYELVGQGVLDARKIGRITVITSESIRRYAAGLPKAEIHTGEKANS